MMNKKGGEKILSIWWLFVLIVMGGAIVIGIVMYYGADVDVRGVEANYLMTKIENCLNNQGRLPENIMDENFSLIDKCGLNDAFGINSPFMVRVSIMEEGAKSRKDIIIGNTPYIKDCEIAASVKADKYPVCLNERLKINSQDYKKSYDVSILSASNQQGRKA